MLICPFQPIVNFILQVPVRREGLPAVHEVGQVQVHAEPGARGQLPLQPDPDVLARGRLLPRTRPRGQPLLHEDPGRHSSRDEVGSQIQSLVFLFLGCVKLVLLHFLC